MSLIDKDEPESRKSASVGATRILRCGYADQTFYSRLAWRSRQLWQEVERESGQSLFLEVGVTWLATRDGGYESKSERTLRRLAIPVERLSKSGVAELFPGPTYDGDLRFGIREPAAGVLRARHAVHALAELASAHGAEIAYEAVFPDDIGGVIDTREESKDVVLWSCGPWLGNLFPGVVPVRATQQSEAYFASDPSWQLPLTGAWIDDAAGVYGVGDLDGTGVKVSWDHMGPEAGPNVGSGEPAQEREIRAYLRRRFPALGEAPLRETNPCRYEMAPNADFVIARHPTLPSNWIVGGGSGHGFKHGPAVAEYVWNLIAADRQPDPRFGLDGRASYPDVR